MREHNQHCRCSFCERIPTGYAGQKFEVQYQAEADGPWKVFGWQNERMGGIVSAVQKWPGAVACKVVEVSPEVQALFHNRKR